MKVVPAGGFTASRDTNAPNAGLSWHHFPAGTDGFFRAPVLISGAREAMLVDGGFTYLDGRAVVDVVKASGKKLASIYISQSDPDYYFNLQPIHVAFPNAKVIAASETLAVINSNVEKKLAIWGPQLKENGPQAITDIVLPEAYDGASLSVDGQTIDIVNADGLANRRYLWVQSLQAVFGGVLVFSGVHVWTADTPTAAARAAWLKNLESMAARKPSVVVPGHLQPGDKLDTSSIEYTRSYLLAFEDELAKAKSSAELIIAMTRRYPSAGMAVALEIGSKVATGEMKWG